ncbi:hypothetical protein GTY87_20440 [Streptomyces sp. SID7813]|uniref:Uncharacterized protein n=1 Tax=Streptomyces coelicolor (strain ATCC BAA-471 / A3(2) / M145) TaxID=100226 RepID=Q9ADQ2_STRCO|nr:hypothetical protein [Streptomyces sp. SID7813]CAC32343.1 hypothetical protein 2SC10A7.07c [Streptomyces coelicolor A3(2)]
MVLAPPPVGGVGEEGYCGLTPEGSHEASTRGGPEYPRGALRRKPGCPRGACSGRGPGCPREACTRRGRPGTRSTAAADPAAPGTADAGLVGTGVADVGLVDAGTAAPGHEKRPGDGT